MTETLANAHAFGEFFFKYLKLDAKAVVRDLKKFPVKSILSFISKLLKTFK